MESTMREERISQNSLVDLYVPPVVAVTSPVALGQNWRVGTERQTHVGGGVRNKALGRQTHKHKQQQLLTSAGRSGASLGA